MYKHSDLQVDFPLYSDWAHNLHRRGEARRVAAQHFGVRSVGSGSCKWRPGWNNSVEQVRIILCNAQSACKNCDHHADIRAVATQYRLGVAQWWVVRGRIVVPIWIVEQLKRNTERRRKPRDPSVVFPRSDSSAVPHSKVA